MRVIVEINEEIYEHTRTKSEDSNDEWNAMRAIANGIPLPKHHGRLIDISEYEKYFNTAIIYDDGNHEHVVYADTIPTIIPADKGVLEKINEKQDSLRATCKAWDEAIERDGYVN